MKRGTFGLTPGAMVGLASLIATGVTGFLGIGAPPSEVSGQAGGWLVLEPLVLPCLGGGFALASLAMLVAILSVRAGALFCVAGLACSGVGAIIALGLEDKLTPVTHLFPVALLVAPALIAISGVQQVRTEGNNVHAG